MKILSEKPYQLPPNPRRRKKGNVYEGWHYSGRRVPAKHFGSYVPVSQYMGEGEGEAFYQQKGYALGVAVGVIGTLVLSLVYKKVKGK